jgi:GT2 family glycosyltransferase
LNIKYAYQANSGLASGKNHGLFLSRAPLVAFLDDDDVFDSCYLEEHLLAHQHYPEVRFAILGYTGLSWESRKSPLMKYVTEVSCELFSYPHLKAGAILDYSYFWGGRSSCKRALLLEYGVFNPVFRFGAEDIELGYRLKRAGLEVVYHPNAISYMLRTLSFDDFCRRCYLQGRSNWVFSRIHPAPEVLTWTQIEGVEQEWKEIEPRFELIMKSGRALDKIAREHAKLDRELDDIGKRLLHRGYAAAFRANRIRGSVEALKASADTVML